MRRDGECGMTTCCTFTQTTFTYIYPPSHTNTVMYILPPPRLHTHTHAQTHSTHIVQTHRLLDEEEREDTALRDRFKDKWSRQASSKLTETMRKEVEKFKGILDAATQADQKVKEKYEGNRQAIILLGKPLEELNAAIPKAGAQASSLSASQVGERQAHVSPQIFQFQLLLLFATN